MTFTLKYLMEIVKNHGILAPKIYTIFSGEKHDNCNIFSSEKSKDF